MPKDQQDPFLLSNSALQWPELVNDEKTVGPPESETVLSHPTAAPGQITVLDGNSHPQMPGAWSEAGAARLGHQGVTLSYGPQAGGQTPDPQTHVAMAASHSGEPQK